VFSNFATIGNIKSTSENNTHHPHQKTTDKFKKKLLTKAKFTSNDEKPTVSKCSDPRCGTCQHLQTGESITFKCGKIFSVNNNMTCISGNLFYCMTFGKCGKNYIGQTGTKLDDIVGVHKQQIGDPSVRDTPCSEHFDICGYGNFCNYPFYKISQDN
jgi:hypothetical protein